MVSIHSAILNLMDRVSFTDGVALIACTMASSDFKTALYCDVSPLATVGVPACDTTLHATSAG